MGVLVLSYIPRHRLAYLAYKLKKNKTLTSTLENYMSGAGLHGCIQCNPILHLTVPHQYLAPQSTYIYRAPQCMSPRWNWDSPTPLAASECAHPPGPKGGGAHSPAAKGVGESQF
jgi:hypothetical protein